MTTLRLAHADRDREVWQLECDHGKTVMASVTDSAEAMETVSVALHEAHNAKYHCRCQPDAFEDYWAKWSDALAQYESDGPPTEPRYEGLGLLHTLTVKALRAGACSACDGSALFITQPGAPEHLTYVHVDDCVNESQHRPPIVLRAGPEGYA